MSRRARLARALIATTACALLVVPFAEGHFSVRIREVHPSTLLGPETAFVELQAYNPGQNRIGGNVLTVYGPSGLEADSFVLPGHVASGQDQRTMLIADSDQFALGADYHYPGLGAALDPSGGAICFDYTPADCVAWGSLSNQFELPFPRAGDPASAIPSGESLTRTIARGCSTALDLPDDTNQSSDDFTLTDPTPRANSETPTELLCIRCDGRPATHVGTTGADTIVGTPGRDVIAALYGRDVVRGRGGADLICGGASSDRLLGGKGRDRLLGGGGRDTCRGGPKNDYARACETKRGI